MFGKKKNQPSKDDGELQRRFATAKEATRLATFLQAAGQLPGAGEQVGFSLRAAFETCRNEALALGERLGVSAAAIDAEIAAACDVDADVLAQASQEQVMAYARDSSEFVRRFLATLKANAPR